MSEQTRDLEKDLEVCAAAPPGPYVITEEGIFNVVTAGQSIAIARNRETSTFIVEARTGWPHAIQRAILAEATVDRLVEELRMLQDELNGRCMD